MLRVNEQTNERTGGYALFVCSFRSLRSPRSFRSFVRSVRSANQRPKSSLRSPCSFRSFVRSVRSGAQGGEGWSRAMPAKW